MRCPDLSTLAPLVNQNQDPGDKMQDPSLLGRFSKEYQQVISVTHSQCVFPRTQLPTTSLQKKNRHNFLQLLNFPALSSTSLSRPITTCHGSPASSPCFCQFSRNGGGQAAQVQTNVMLSLKRATNSIAKPWRWQSKSSPCT